MFIHPKRIQDTQRILCVSNAGDAYVEEEGAFFCDSFVKYTKQENHICGTRCTHTTTLKVNQHNNSVTFLAIK